MSETWVRRLKSEVPSRRAAEAESLFFLATLYPQVYTLALVY